MSPFPLEVNFPVRQDFPNEKAVSPNVTFVQVFPLNRGMLLLGDFGSVVSAEE
jgi:hypothetical protein